VERSSQEVAAFVRRLKLASKMRYELDPTIRGLERLPKIEALANLLAP
jgi:hypothetical protein